MRIAKARFVSPDHNFAYGVAAIAISIFVFAYSTRFGQVSVLAYYALWLPLVAVDYRQVLGNYGKVLLDHRFRGVRVPVGVLVGRPRRHRARRPAILSHVVCALIAARTVNIRTLTLGVLAGVSVVILYSLAFGGYHLRSARRQLQLSSGRSPRRTSSGLFASLGLYFAYACLAILRERGLWRMLALVCAGLSAYALIASQSAASIIATVATLVRRHRARRGPPVFAARQERSACSIGTALVIAVAVRRAQSRRARPAARRLRQGRHAHRADLSVVGGLGGRCRGHRSSASATRPIGYRAFPRPSGCGRNSTSTSRSGFHFHNTYIEVLVELGFVGLVLIGLVMVRVLLGHLGRMLNDGHNQASRILFGIAVMLLVRSFVEVDVLHPYVVGSFLLYYAAGSLAVPQGARLFAARLTASPRAAAPRLMKKLYGIQYLRAVAALGVVVFHAAERSGTHFAIGAAGVDVFFVISGFIMWILAAGQAHLAVAIPARAPRAHRAALLDRHRRHGRRWVGRPVSEYEADRSATCSARSPSSRTIRRPTARSGRCWCRAGR